MPSLRLPVPMPTAEADGGWHGIVLCIFKRLGAQQLCSDPWERDLQNYSPRLVLGCIEAKDTEGGGVR